ncbi:redoxin domain-containing protein [Maribellus comscasis]|uniref:Redoxin domain-containing protein n=1 Tax=Maribellus comscasis TaxID=2681766 RepID=A0A6I6K448_9BACT|nr:redoxin domain-containing protein [Maribellus comscasis]QGY47222.1 redoxin domain-containing protein [Maribellus comscasis]
MRKLIILMLLCSTFPVFAQEHEEPKTLEPGAKAIDFNLKGTDDKMYSLSSFKDKDILIIIFSAPHCPTSQIYQDRIISIQKEYRDKGVQVVMINPNNPDSMALEERGYTDVGDSFEDMKIRAKDKGYNFPFLYDGETVETSFKYGPVSTPHTFVFDKGRVLRYVGRIDDSVEEEEVTQQDLRNALDAILDGKEVNPKQTKVIGCSVKWKWKTDHKNNNDKWWANHKVLFEEISGSDLKKLVQNNTDKLRVINVWATWCGPCVSEFSELIDTYRMYMWRDLEMYTINIDRIEKKDKVHKFLLDKHAAFNNNYIFGSGNTYELIENIDPEWQGNIPHTIIVEPGGKIVWRQSGALDFFELRKQIVDNRLLGRYFN